MRRAFVTTLVLAVLCLPLVSVPAAAGPQPPAGWTDGYVVANGIRIHYWRTGGAKPALVLAHGSSDDGLCWTNLAKELTDQYDVIMFDARGTSGYFAAKCATEALPIEWPIRTGRFSFSSLISPARSSTCTSGGSDAVGGSDSP